MCDNSIVALHTHTDKSNFRLLDSINSVKELITTAVELNHTGLAITDHESISAHVEAIQVTNKLKQEGKIPQDFKLILGNEIYLVDSLEEVRDNYVGGGVTKFPHFLLLAKNKSGHEALRKLSSIAWSENHFTTGKMHRTPTLKSQLADMVKEYPNTLIATTACLGSESSIHILGMKEAQENEDDELVQFHRGKLMEFFHWCIETFGKDHFFIELQPARSEEQIYVNERLVMLSAFYGLKCVMATDAHYLRPEQQLAHEAFLNAQDGEREVAAFYSDTYLHTIEEIYEKTSYLPREVVEDAIKNTVMIGEMIENYTIEKDVQIPTVPIPEFELKHRFRNFYTEFPYISKMAHSDNEQDRFMIHCLEEGFMKYIPYRTISEKRKHELIERINLELGEMWEISQVIKQSVASYYITVKDIVDLIWDDDCGGNSLVGAGRGSAGGFLTCMLLGITQINPLDYGVEMPHWRHLHRSRPDVNRLDIDIDTEGTKRERIIYALKRKYGEHNIIQVSTQTKVGSKSAINTACRGLGIDAATAGYISGLIPWERGENWTLTECLEGNEENGRKAIPEFIKEIEAYPRLKETALAIEGKVTQRSIHAGGVILFNEPYYKSNALMRAPNGNLITQFNLDDSQAVGNMKFD